MCFNSRKSFTLIELLLVVVILSVLVSMVVPRLVGRSEQARVAAAKTDILSNIATALELYEMDNGMFPATEQGLSALLTEPTSSPTPVNWNGPYVKRMPKDPWSREYKYKSPGERNIDYDLFSLGKDGVEGGGDDIVNWEEE